MNEEEYIYSYEDLLDLVKLQKRFNNLEEEYKDRTDTIHDLLGRIDKAIEYIKEHKMYNYDDICISNDIDAEELEEILKGEKDD